MPESINARIQADLKAAMKARDEDRLRAIRMIRAALIEVAKEGTGEPDDERVLAILRRLRKQRVESAEAYRAGAREELAIAEEAEIRVIDGYLPQLADEATTRGYVEAAIASLGATSKKEIGKVMGAVMKAHGAQVDGTLVRSLADALLA